MQNLWSPRTKVQLERELWIAVMQAQSDLGFDIPVDAINAYWSCVSSVDLESIRKREEVTHHDVKARLEEFNALAGYQFAHLGMTGRDLDDNLELWLQRRGLEILAGDLADRGHSAVAADLGRLASKVRFRGIVGAVGTGQDQLDLLGGDPRALDELNDRVARFLEFAPGARLHSVGQVYPRSLDYQTASSLTATLGTLRPKDGSISPHPVVMRGYVAMLAELSGDQWAEGDVSCSSVRRVALPGLFLHASAHVSLL
jgi:adenylosuccinate lyase